MKVIVDPEPNRRSDGRTRDYLKTDQNTPLPYIAQDDAHTIKSLRTTDTVSFQHPVIRWPLRHLVGQKPPLRFVDADHGTVRSAFGE